MEGGPAISVRGQITSFDVELWCKVVRAVQMDPESFFHVSEDPRSSFGLSSTLARASNRM